MTSPPAVDRHLLRQAAQLLARLEAADASDTDHADCERWREQSDAHRRAWALAEQLRQQFDAVPAGVGPALRERAGIGTVSRGRRRALRMLTGVVLAAPAGWLASRLPWHAWSADFHTATGERHDVLLADGTQITLGSASAVNVGFDAGVRRIHLLSGEIMVRPADHSRDATNPQSERLRPAALLVQTAEGVVEALGTQFSVRQQNGFTRVAAFRGGAQLSPAASDGVLLMQDQSSTFTRTGVAAPRPLDAREAMWTRGLLYANRMPVADLVAELARYRHGILRYAADVAGLRVSGIYQLTDTDATLALLQRTYPLRLRSITPYWTVVEAR
ncbi:FecR domain-containing protein [Paraburkholderia sp. MMS20-SJTR3]|uniref:FecR domain-containing protein n=1 Tax=Paraburkholderia sejongensis TaxID=2886946 RepID=A0ABS8K272_9BURK|nr:FecR domain-containing protein [Paraburkholderia sp. MMS20-SJTR3]MCC8396252.1 FecR domain-containing protein [Paraburkholderia sp. MMS20-SJTR3]